MAMTVRIPAELDRQLNALAHQLHISKHALIIEGVELVVQRLSRQATIAGGLDFVRDHDRELLARLEDS